MGERSVMRSRLWVVIAASLLWVGCGPAKAPLNSQPPLDQQIPQLIQNLDSKSRTQRNSAVNFLATLGEKGQLGEDQEKILAKLREMQQKDESEIVKKSAAEAIAKIEGS